MAALTGRQEERLRALRREYAARLPERITSLADAIETSLLAAHGGSRPRLEELVHQTHRLCGSAAIFGFKDVSSAARGLEGLLLSLVEGTHDDDRRNGVARQLEALKSALLAGAPVTARRRKQRPHPAREAVSGPAAPRSSRRS